VSALRWIGVGPAHTSDLVTRKGGVMKKLLLRILFLLGGLVAGLVAGLLLPAAQRLRLSRQLAAGIGRVAERMPDG
jgi:hypothetical protein